MLMVNIPATCGLIVLSTEIIRLLLERGHFTPADTAATAAALRLYAIGLVGYSTTRIASPVFYAIGRSRVPVILSVVSVSVNLVLSLVFVKVIGFRGLALATSIAALVNATLCVVLLRAQLDGMGGRRLPAVFTKVTIASAAMSVAVVTVNHSLSGIESGGGTLVQASALLAAVVSGLVALAIAARLLQIEEFATLMAAPAAGYEKLLAR